MSEERNEFTPDLFTLEDEDGNEQVFELLDVLEYEDNTYYALVPYYGDDEDALAQDDGEFVILKTEEVNGEEMLVSIEEDAEYETIGNKFLECLNEIYGDEDDEEDEDDDESEFWDFTNVSISLLAPEAARVRTQLYIADVNL